MLENGIVVLDSGCGPATWTFEMGECYPRSTFHGIDASCVFPENIKPANVEFVIGNIAKHVPYPDNTFDYIHQRLLFLGLTDSDWTNVRKRGSFERYINLFMHIVASRDVPHIETWRLY
jgi:ubiquinone/menaquinone biosynthesis C-methylase UbiE